MAADSYPDPDCGTVVAQPPSKSIARTAVSGVFIRPSSIEIRLVEVRGRFSAVTMSSKLRHKETSEPSHEGRKDERRVRCVIGRPRTALDAHLELGPLLRSRKSD